MYHVRELPKKETLVLVVLGFSTVGIIPLSMCIVAIIGYRYKKGILRKGDILKLILITCPTIIQTYSVLTSGRMDTDLLIAEKIRDTIPVYLILMGKTISLQSMIFYTGRFIIIGIVVIVFILYQMKDKLNIVLFSLGYALFVYVFNTFPIGENEININILMGNFRFCGRYWFPTLSIFSFFDNIVIGIWNPKRIL